MATSPCIRKDKNDCIDVFVRKVHGDRRVGSGDERVGVLRPRVVVGITTVRFHNGG